jgi:putative hydrolase
VTPVDALLQAIHYLDRAHEGGFKTRAFVRALDVVRSLDPDEVAERSRANTLTELDGIGPATARLIAEALAGEGTYLAKLDAETRIEISPKAAAYREALRGDCHLHSRWSDGAATMEAMARTAEALGHEYMVVTDHSARLTVAHGLSRDRLLAQLDELDEVRRRVAPFRVLSGMEVDIFEDGTLDLDDDLLGRLDVVVASVHSKLSMEPEAMTRRMVVAAANPHVDILGHCTGRMVGKRAASRFDADYVFAACARFGTAVELNSRPERLDPPVELIEVALSHGCQFSIDSDAHSTGQLEWQPHGCEMAAAAGVPLERIVNTWSAADLLAWTGEEIGGSAR